MRCGCESESERALVAAGKWEKGRMLVILGGGWWYAGVKIGKHRCVCLFVPFGGETHERCCRSILRARTKLVRMQLVYRFENCSLAWEIKRCVTLRYVIDWQMVAAIYRERAVAAALRSRCSHVC